MELYKSVGGGYNGTIITLTEGNSTAAFSNIDFSSNRIRNEISDPIKLNVNHGKSFQNVICNNAFTWNSHTFHVGEKSHRCEICDKVLTTKRNLIQHMLTHSGAKPFSCERCNRGFTTKQNLNRHKLLHTGERPFKCHLCNKGFQTSYHLKKHKFSHSRKRSFTYTGQGDSIGEICYVIPNSLESQVLGSSGILNKISDANKLDQCDVKPTQYVKHDNGLIWNPHTYIYSGEKSHRCEICDKVLTTRRNLMQHMLTHSGTKPFSCERCNRGFTTKQNLNRHELLHTGERPFKCHLCNKGFQTTYHLKQHKRSHSREKSFTCDVCTQNFSRIFDLKKHKIIHFHQKTFICDICNKALTSKRNLKQHKLIHLNVKPFVCEYCSKGFTTKQNLERHKQFVHVKEKSNFLLSQKKCKDTEIYLLANDTSWVDEDYLLKINSSIVSSYMTPEQDVIKIEISETELFGSPVSGHAERNIFVKEEESRYGFHNINFNMLEFESQNSSRTLNEISDPNKLICEVCDKVLSTKWNLMQHMLTHSGTKPFSCERCNRGFTTKQNLNRHELLHTGERPFKCHLCNKGFQTTYHLKQHRFTHCKQKLFTSMRQEDSFGEYCSINPKSY